MYTSRFNVYVCHILLYSYDFTTNVMCQYSFCCCWCSIEMYTYILQHNTPYYNSGYKYQPIVNYDVLFCFDTFYLTLLSLYIGIYCIPAAKSSSQFFIRVLYILEYVINIQSYKKHVQKSCILVPMWTSNWKLMFNFPIFPSLYTLDLESCYAKKCITRHISRMFFFLC